jgi:hypothetical protein
VLLDGSTNNDMFGTVCCDTSESHWSQTLPLKSFSGAVPQTDEACMLFNFDKSVYRATVPLVN